MKVKYSDNLKFILSLDESDRILDDIFDKGFCYVRLNERLLKITKSNIL